MCGIVGIVSSADVSYSLYCALYALQHRGQDSAGIVTTDYGPMVTHRKQGLVSSIFDEDTLKKLTGTVGIGHVRYPTTGCSTAENIQPFFFTFKSHHIALAHNGNITNYTTLRDMFEEKGQIFLTTSDTEIISKIIIDELLQNHTIEDAVRRCMRIIEGSYSVVLLIDGELYAFRDPFGLRPLGFGKTAEGGLIVASESVAVEGIGGTFERDILPGEMIHVDQNRTIRFVECAKAEHYAYCIFEYIYFARSDSVIDGALVYDVRRSIGSSLAQEAPVDADIVCTIPDSGTAYAVGYSEQSNISFVECLIKNRYMGRTFIMPSQEMRERSVRIKLNPISQHVRDRAVILVDDSIVRGTTSRMIVESVRHAGAAEVHMRIGSPIIKEPCYFGVDMATRDQLIGSEKECDEICKQIGATSLHYASLNALVDAIGIAETDLCTGCVTGTYPFPVGRKPCKRTTIQYM
ncbi:MAG: amidophosphoribosyltransferase [Methanomicrobiales archaeon]|jgi:amidophosphoribosyltransferase|nr:amidophosphoribosyltransferase [Methanomicrobiales archaeon]